jgi:hypothetical protein
VGRGREPGGGRVDDSLVTSRLSSRPLLVFAGLLLLAVVTVWLAPGASSAASRPATTASSKDKDKDKDNDRSKGKGEADDKSKDDNSSGKGNDAEHGDRPGSGTAPAPGGSPAPGAAPTGDERRDDDKKGKDGDKGRSPGTSGGGSTGGPAPTTPGALLTKPVSSAAALAAPSVPLPAPKLAQHAGMAAVVGDVLVRTGDGRPIEHLGQAAQIPTGTVVDARQGAIELVTAVDGVGGTQTARFWGGIFEVRQGRNAVAQIVLRHGDFDRCRVPAAAGPAARAAARRKPVRSLWGSDDRGKFQTRGRGSVATVRGTRWLTEDYCDGTRTTVVEGAVTVRDLGRGRTVVVKAGESYFAPRARPRASR